jgi:hypothetical protein
VLSLRGRPLPPKCVFAQVIQARSYFASTVPMDARCQITAAISLEFSYFGVCIRVCHPGTFGFKTQIVDLVFSIPVVDMSTVLGCRYQPEHLQADIYSLIAI